MTMSATSITQSEISYEVIQIDMIREDLVMAANKAMKLAISRRWKVAIQKACKWLLAQDAIEYDRASHTLVYISDEKVYKANGACQCIAYEKETPCKHRAASKLVRRALEMAGI
jgi:hypothetical protein